MPIRKNEFSEGGVFHVFNRGINKERIFFNPGNFLYCINLTKRYSGNCQVSILAYCLMPNHFHFLLRQDGVIPLSRFIGLVFNAYVQAVNKQQNRQGALFKSRFKHSRIDRQEYLIHLCRYIHLNPVRAGLAGSPDQWPHSDYPEWVGDRAARKFHASAVSANFRGAEDYRRFVMDSRETRDDETMLRAYLMD